MSLKGILKVLVVGFLGLGLWIALFAVKDTVSERSRRRDQVYQDMAQTTAGSQIVAGPLLVFPYELKRPLTGATYHTKTVLPRYLKLDARLKVERRYRSLYEILLYGSEMKLEGRFEFPSPKSLDVPPDATLRWQQPYLVVLIQDGRGLTTIPVLNWNGKEIPVQPSNRGMLLGIDGGVHAELPFEVTAGGTFPFSIDLSLIGTQSLSWVPVGEESKVLLAANWAHPSFQGRSLPKNHSITPQGFQAEWESTNFSSNISELITNPTDRSNLRSLEVGVRFIQPVDIYLQAERSVKYGFLFIALTFGFFMVFETLKQLSIHPVQYGFVGMALVLFYVLLLALSEHIAFGWAYLIASVASVSLLGFYVRYVVQSWKRSLGFAAALALLDGVIYGILMSEDYALLGGALLLFALLSTSMIITRRVNWNDLKFGR